jgi:hypothetical protein
MSAFIPAERDLSKKPRIYPREHVNTMRKELIFAIIFGIFIGLIVAFGLLRINGVMKKNSGGDQNRVSEVGGEQNSVGNQTGSNSITLLKPIDHQVSGSKTIAFSGVTRGESYIIATGGTYDFISQSRKDGTFDFEYEIEPSFNSLNVYSISGDNQRSNTSLELVYSSEATQKETDDNIDEKVENKLENVQNMAEFFQGTITDITDGGVQIKTKEGEIKQISYTSGSTSFAKIGKTTTKITITDIALGDYIIALGYKEDNGLLNAFRILVTQPASSEDIKIFFGTVLKKNKTDMVVSEKNSGEIDIEIDNNTKTYKGVTSNPEKVRFADIKEDNLVIGTYLVDKETNTVRRIYILGNTPSD